MKPLFLVLLFGYGESPIEFFVAAGFLAMLAAFFVSAITDGFNVFKFEWLRKVNKDFGPKAEAAVTFQLGKFLYFTKLSLQRRAEFVQRVLNFMESHNIDGIGDYNPGTPEKIHVAAAATQLTFGLKDFVFENFENIILYPQTFKLSPDGPMMKGATTPNGVIRISMKDFEEGYANPTNKLNVGLHELGHALLMEFLKAIHEDNEVKQVVFPYLATSDKIMNAGKDRDDFLRDYAFTNRHEFFAVSVEHFFEAPVEFKEKLPELYKVMSNLLHQDPASNLPDYGIKR
ncbi:hypothetical protein BH09BAC5_BH09BAC5_15830 [soil metagenome]